MEIMLEHVAKGMWLVLLLSLPAVLLAAGIGLIIGILQAVTQVQEQTISAAPKILAVFLLLILGGGLMMNQLNDYVRESFQIAFNEVPGDGIFILPPRARTLPGKQVEGFMKTREATPSGTARGFFNKPSGETEGGEVSSGSGVSTGVTPKARASVSEEMYLDKRDRQEGR